MSGCDVTQRESLFAQDETVSAAAASCVTARRHPPGGGSPVESNQRVRSATAALHTIHQGESERRYIMSNLLPVARRCCATPGDTSIAKKKKKKHVINKSAAAGAAAVQRIISHPPGSDTAVSMEKRKTLMIHHQCSCCSSQDGRVACPVPMMNDVLLFLPPSCFQPVISSLTIDPGLNSSTTLILMISFAMGRRRRGSSSPAALFDYNDDQ